MPVSRLERDPVTDAPPLRGSGTDKPVESVRLDTQEVRLVPSSSRGRTDKTVPYQSDEKFTPGVGEEE